MLFQLFKSLLMALPQSTCYRVLRDRLVSVSRFRQSTIHQPPKLPMPEKRRKLLTQETKSFVERVLATRQLHVEAAWQTIRQESLETPKPPLAADAAAVEPGSSRRSWLGYESKEEEARVLKGHQQMKERHKKARELRKAKRSPGRAGARLESFPQARTKLGEEMPPPTPESVAEEKASDANIAERNEQWKKFWDEA